MTRAAPSLDPSGIALALLRVGVTLNGVFGSRLTSLPYHQPDHIGEKVHFLLGELTVHGFGFSGSVVPPFTVGEFANSLKIAIRNSVQHSYSISALLWRTCLLKTGQAKIRHRGQGLRIPRIHVVPLSHSGKQLVIKVNGNSQGRIWVIDRSRYGGRTYRCQRYP